MFEIGDYVLNATNGICKIKEIVELDMSGDKNPKSYFLLRPMIRFTFRSIMLTNVSEK